MSVMLLDLAERCHLSLAQRFRDAAARQSCSSVDPCHCEYQTVALISDTFFRVALRLSFGVSGGSSIILPRPFHYRRL
jgi:hypothetical protein